jgi:predicted MFS family arabinose efflux permease
MSIPLHRLPPRSVCRPRSSGSHVEPGRAIRRADQPRRRATRRVSALNSTATYGARPLGALLGAAISARWGMDACLIAAAAAFLAQALIIVMSPAARLAGIPEGAAVAQ